MATRKWDRDSIIAKLKELYASREDVSPRTLQRKFPGLYATRIKIFGGSTAMYEAAKIPMHALSKMPDDYWTKPRVKEKLKERQEAGKDMRYSTLCKDDPALLAQCNNKFGTYVRACESIGIPAESVLERKRSKKSDRKDKPANYWTKNNITKEIQEMNARGENLHYESVRKNKHYLITQSDRKFGGWHKACEAAKIPTNEYFERIPPNYYTEAQIFKEIRLLHEKHEDLSMPVIEKTYLSLYNAASTRYNGWYNCLKKMGIDPGPYRRQAAVGYWTEDKIKQMIVNMVANEEEITARYVYLNHGDLFSAASSIFGNWENAIRAAGYDYEKIRKVHKAYSKDELLDWLRALQAKGMPLHFQAARSVSQSKTNIIIKVFGSYRAAIEKIGLDYDKIQRNMQIESRCGINFEKYVAKAFDILDLSYHYNMMHHTEHGTIRPDFVDSDTGIWLDAKLHSYSGGISETIAKYRKFTNSIVIIYLDGNNRIWPQDENLNVEFRPIDTYYDALRLAGAEQLIRDFEKMKKKIPYPKYQSEIA